VPNDPKIRRLGGHTLVIGTGGTLQVEAGATVTGLAAVAEQAALADLAGALTGTTDGTLEDVAAINIGAVDAANPTEAEIETAVNGAITATNLQLKELQATLNALLARLRLANVIADA